MERNVRLLEIDLHGQAAEEGRVGGSLRGPRTGAGLGDRGPRPQAIARRIPDEDWYPEKVDRAEVLAGLARSLIATGQSELMSRFVDHALATPKKYPLTAAHITALVGPPPLAQEARQGAVPGPDEVGRLGPRAARSAHGPGAPGAGRLPPRGPGRLQVRRLRRAEAIPQGPARVGAPLPRQGVASQAPRARDPTPQVRPGPRDRTARAPPTPSSAPRTRPRTRRA